MSANGGPGLENEPELQGRLLVAGPPETDHEQLGVVKQQRAENCALGLPSVPHRAYVRDAEVAIVGFGPSLKRTYGVLALDYAPRTIITTSKAHDFLLERGIKPTIHIDVDYREHKAGFVKEFDPDVQYVFASHIHPTYLKRALSAGVRVQLFHSQMPDGGPYEPGYLKSEAQFDAGLQAAYLAYHWGFRRQAWLGIDASYAGDNSHAGEHGSGTHEAATPHKVQVGSYLYRSNGLMVRQALHCEKMLRSMPKVLLKVHGDGMIRPFLQERGKVRVA